MKNGKKTTKYYKTIKIYKKEIFHHDCVTKSVPEGADFRDALWLVVRLWPLCLVAHERVDEGSNNINKNIKRSKKQ